MRLRLGKLFKSKVAGKVYCTAIVAAAGSSTRMAGQDKLFIEIGGKPVLMHTLSVLNACDSIQEIIVVTRSETLENVAKLCADECVTKVSKIIVGGKTRLESVWKGVLEASPKANLIAVHDGARPFVTDNIVTSVVKAAVKSHAAAPAVPVTSTLKQAKNGFVVKTIDRDSVFEVQTPQVFTTELIKGALQNAVNKSLYITDECMAVEALGCPVKLTTGSRDNIKLTTSMDIAFAEAIYDRRSSHENRARL